MGPPISRSGSSGGSISAPALESREQPASSLSPTPVPPSSQTEPPKGRALSCSECKRRKIKCDRGCPCGPCILRNDQARCKPVIRWEAGCSLSEFSMLQNRVFELEGRVADMQHMLGGETSVGGASLLPLRSSVASVPPKQEPGGPAAVGSPSTNNGLAQTSTAPSQQRGGGENDAVMMLEVRCLVGVASETTGSPTLSPPGLCHGQPRQRKEGRPEAHTRRPLCRQPWLAQHGDGS